jgi:hypothetical protein
LKTLFTLFIAFLFFSTTAFSQGVAINDSKAAPHSSAILDISSTQKGFLPPRMTMSQRDSILNPANGLVVFNSTSGCLNYFFAGSWYEWCGAVVYPTGTIHCTATPTAVVDVLNPATGRTWMDRNLGASRAAISSNDSLAYGDLYQWGRRADGHQCRNSATTTTLSSTDQPPHGNFIFSANSPIDWRSPQNDNLWQGVNGINNPCPSGYRVPTTAELNAERASWSTQNIAGAFASPLKLPKAGRRFGTGNGTYGDSTLGLYWTSLLVLQNVSTLFFNSDISMFVSNARADGASVRCIKEAALVPGSITMLNCNASTPTGTLTQGQSATGVSNSVPYSGGNGGNHAGQTVTSTGVAGLTATLAAGSFANGAGNLVYTITGTPASSGFANFALNIGGQNCTLTRLVNAGGPAYPAGTVHCTQTPTAVLEVLNPATGRIWMDRNLGASRVATSSTDADGYGDLYQWGRRADGHQCRNSATTTNVSSNDQPIHGNFIIDASDWRNPRNNNLWQGVNGTNNPCPYGFRLPTDMELQAEFQSWSTPNTEGAFASPLKLPHTGYRFYLGGNILFSSTFYHSSSISGEDYTRFLIFGYFSNARIAEDGRAIGASVRCIKESSSMLGTINGLNCNTSTSTGTLTEGEAASGVSSSVPYSGGNGGAHAGQIVTSTGVSGLTATLTAGSLANGAGNLLYTISGTPSSSGFANFALNIGGQNCTLTRLVNAGGPAYPAGTVHCTPTPTAVIEVINPTTGKTWMDRNLGAARVATSRGDAEAYGDLYQWGRRADGHQCRTSPTTSTLSSTDQPAHGSFILESNSYLDWRSPQNNNLWQGVNGVNNPCPIGFRLPTDNELNSERLSWNSNNVAGAFASPLKWPLAGERRSNNGSLWDFGSDGTGYYWSSTVSDSKSGVLIFESSDARFLPGIRITGNSVRCIKEAVPVQGAINSLNCVSAGNNGTLTIGIAASGVNSSVPYTGGNGGTHAGQAVASTGVTGLTATLSTGSFANGAGTLVYNITGTPATSGTASFALNIGGQTCTLTRTVNAPAGPAYPAGTVHCTPTPTAVVEVLNPATGRTWMDRNLGATRAAISSTDAEAYGDLYLWGRRADGHQCRNSAITTTLSSSDQPAHGSFIVAQNSPYDWRSPGNDQLWQGVNGVNNPCPSGYRIPTEPEFIAERSSWISRNSAGAFTSPLKLPMAGGRDGSINGSLYDVGTFGYYWNSTVFNNASSSLGFSSSAAYLNPIYRASGISVRCIKDNASIQGSISALNCDASTLTGTLRQGVAATGVSNSVPYSGGNGGTHVGQTVASTGVAGLTATLAAGSFANGAGILVYTITGTPESSGIARFVLNIGGQNCTVTRLSGFAPDYPNGTVHCTPTPTAVVEVVNPATGKTWMDRNLGATRVATSSTDAEAYGDLYQWGRRADGHQCRNSSTTATVSSTPQPAHGNFITTPHLSPFDWLVPQINNLWQGQYGLNNPCPIGYKIPTAAELNAELASWVSQNSTGAFVSPLKFTIAGARFNDGSLQWVGSLGYYWTSTLSELNYPNLLYTSSGGAFMNILTRNSGYSVRCIKEMDF